MHYNLGLYEKSMPDELPISEKLFLAKKAGYDYLELSIDESDEKLGRLDWSGEELFRLREAQERAGLPILSVCLSGHRRFPLGDPEPELRRRSLEIMEKAIRLAAGIGARIIQLAGYDVYYKQSSEQTVGFFHEGLESAVEMASAQGVILAFETMETPFLNTVSKGMRWVRQINSPYLQIYPDTGNLTNAALSSGVSALEDMEEGLGHIVALHLKQSLPGVFREVPYEKGHVDFVALAAKALSMGVRLFVGEFWHNQADWQQALAGNCRFLRGALLEAQKALVSIK